MIAELTTLVKGVLIEVKLPVWKANIIMVHNYFEGTYIIDIDVHAYQMEANLK